ncbi:hypothetical protein BX661DRAFT_17271 [Kickxella alabastrina]|uniref:uncharacterized protein n=1 Tax=Kickxella alabastrina TaxID=61397 RepID=UPI00221E4CBC|nr:uncharacterized protein BX661DRAFT_17271 [Kickxella alabastrina]KAI7827788.1 hypothetical protein BX661DRAFT_17271 [Kickxella alabastrina]
MVAKNLLWSTLPFLFLFYFFAFLSLFLALEAHKYSFKWPFLFASCCNLIYPYFSAWALSFTLSLFPLSFSHSTFAHLALLFSL